MKKELEDYKKAIENFKKYIDNLEKQQNYLYNMEDYYKDDIEQNELLLKMLHSILNYIENSISKEVIEDKIEELNEGIKRDMINYDKVKDESWKMAIHRSMTQKIETKKVLQQLLEGK